MRSGYDPKAIEAKWQERWQRQRTAEIDLRHAQAKELLLVAAARPQEGHRPEDRQEAGPGRIEVLGDTLFRFLRMNGRRVLSPVVSGRREKLRPWGLLHDWTKEVDRGAPELQRWSQWLFLRMLEKDLAYQDGGQWFFRITAHADRLLSGLAALAGWPESVKAAQRHWLTAHLRDWWISRPGSGWTPIPVAGGGAMDAGVEASWAYLRHLSPRDASRLVDPEAARRWLPVDHYLCGVEGHTLRLLHARFLCRVLHDLGCVAVEEPFSSVVVVTPLRRRAAVKETATSPGADAARVYALFVGPPEKEAEWSGEAVAGAHRFLEQVWRIGERLHGAPPIAPADGALERERHAAIERVTRSLKGFRFNTAVPALMRLANKLSRALEEQTASRLRCEEAFDTLLQLLHPLAPHITEELWERRDHVETLLDSSWPEYDEGKLRRARIELVVQVDGKLRDRVEVDAEATEKEARAAAMASPNVEEHLAGREVAKAVFVPGRLINLVTRRSA